MGLGFGFGVWVWGSCTERWFGFHRSVFRFVFGLLGLRLSRIYVSNYLIKALYIIHIPYTHIYIYIYIYV